MSTVAEKIIPERPSAIPVLLQNIPQELRALIRFVVWRYTWKAKDWKWDKPPYDAKTGGLASTADPSTWCDWQTVVAAYETGDWDGIGWVFTRGTDHCGVDQDDVLNPDSQELTSDAVSLLAVLDSYTEISPSGTGVKTICRGTVTLPLNDKGEEQNGKRRDGIEFYRAGRYFTLTGQVWPNVDSAVHDRSEALQALIARLTNSKTAGKNCSHHAGSCGIADDQQLIEMATANDKTGAKFSRLLAGDASDYPGKNGEPDESRADLALCGYFAFWAGPDESRIDRLFRQSGLMRDKWNRDDYRHGTIKLAIDGRNGEFYKGNGQHRRTESGSDCSGKKLPRIDAGDGDLPKIARAAWKAIEDANEPPTILRHAGLPARIESDDHGAPIIRSLNEDRMRHVMARTADWFKVKTTGRGEEKEAVEVPAPPPRDVVRDLLAMPNPPLPILTRITEAPVMAPDGSIQLEAGYSRSTQTFYRPAAGFSVPRVPERPDQDEVRLARQLLCTDLLGDFPFVKGESGASAEMAHAVALLILPFVRELIPDATPLHLIEKPSPGTGATLLIDALAQPAIGRPIPAMTEGRDEDEWRKRVTSKLRSGSEFVLIDNLRRRLDSAAVASAITSPTWEDRLLGASELVRIPVRCAWVATGNNPAVSSEIARRTVRIRLDAKQDRPWLRDGFRHPDLRGWVRAHRGQLVWAALTLARAWFVKGRPEGSHTLGMFEAWAKVIGGILDVAGIGGFLSNLSEFYEDSDQEGREFRDFLTQWWMFTGDKLTTVADLFLHFDEAVELNLGDGEVGSRKKRMGLLLRQNRDRVYDLEIGEMERVRVRLERGKDKHKTAQWRLVRTDRREVGE